MPDDLLFMQRALQLAALGSRAVSPNPMVGCVIVRQGRIIAEGWHQACGADHAEVNALKKAGKKAKGATMFVTLEPCAHWGRTPPCVDSVIAAGIRRVVIAMRDPNPLTNGASIRKMRAAGLQVDVGVCAGEALELNAAFEKYILKKMPYVTAKIAQTLDGKVCTRSGESKWITSVESREFSHDRRNEYDAVITGINTVLADDPVLEASEKRLTKVIVDSSLRLPENARLLSGTISGQVIAAVTKAAPLARIRRLERRGVNVIVCPAKRRRVDMTFLFRKLAQKELARILIEGGPAVIGSALREDLVDVLDVYIAPKIIGDIQARASVAGLDVLRLARAPRFSVVGVRRCGPDVVLTLKR